MPRTVVYEDSKAIFAANLDRYLRLRGIQNPWVANQIRHEDGRPVSRQAVHLWRIGQTYPSDDLRHQLYRILQCSEVDLSQPPSAVNLRNLMEARKLSVEALAEAIKVEPSEVQAMLTGAEKPPEPLLKRLVKVLQCTQRDIMEAPDILSLSMWAKREDIPITRAEALFDMEILTGDIETPFGRLIPAKIKAPQDSKRLVAEAKRWPFGGKKAKDRFIGNLKFLMAEQNMENSVLAAKVGVQAATISHWRTNIRTPEEGNLQRIAEALGVSYRDLMTRDFKRESKILESL